MPQSVKPISPHWFICFFLHYACVFALHAVMQFLRCFSLCPCLVHSFKWFPLIRIFDFLIPLLRFSTPFPVFWLSFLVVWSFFSLFLFTVLVCCLSSSSSSSSLFFIIPICILHVFLYFQLLLHSPSRVTHWGGLTVRVKAIIRGVTWRVRQIWCPLEPAPKVPSSFVFEKSLARKGGWRTSLLKGLLQVVSPCCRARFLKIGRRGTFRAFWSLACRFSVFRDDQILFHPRGVHGIFVRIDKHCQAWVKIRGALHVNQSGKPGDGSFKKGKNL